jgi:hypothetical protein
MSGAGETRHPFLRPTTSGVLLASLLLVATACSGDGKANTSSAHSADSITISNQGGALEGHTPTGFAGSGTGLFAGDNLNASFPDGVGVQLYVTFALPRDVGIGDARIVSDVLHVSWTPFEDLGPLLAEPVSYETFGPELFDLIATGPHSECKVTEETAIACDVSTAVEVLVGEGSATAQFRIRFTRPADGDGQQDLAMFFTRDSNTNESGIFELEITPDV